MSTNMLYYLAWEEDDWLDEVLDYFRGVNAIVPTNKSFQLMQEQRVNGVVDQVILVCNVAHEKEKTKAFLGLLQKDDVWKKDPLYLVGVEESEEQEWKIAYPHTKVIVIRGSKYEFDYEAVLKDMKAEWSD